MNNISKLLFTKVVSYNYCIGCGVCAGVCPSRKITMEFSKIGEYRPVALSECHLDNCNLCIKACPFWNQEVNEDTIAKLLYEKIPGIKKENHINYFLKCIFGYSNVATHRLNGSSGGLATWLQEQLLKEKQVNFVINVARKDRGNNFYQYSLASDLETIKENSRSCYYPVNLAEMIEFMKNNKGDYAVTGVPCFIKALRLAALNHKVLAKRIKVLIGLTCGQNQNKFFVDYLASMRGYDPKDLSRVTFRIKDPHKAASDFGCTLETKSGKEFTVFWSEGMGDAWHRGYFRPKACDFCDDVFADTADVTFMDAWLPEFSRDYKGTNLAVIRHPIVLDIFERAKETTSVMVGEIDTARVLESQKGVIDRKVRLLPYRLFKARKSGYLPQKRVPPQNNLTFIRRLIHDLKQINRLNGRRATFDRGRSLYQKVQYRTFFSRAAIEFMTRFERFIIKIRKG